MPSGHYCAKYWVTYCVCACVWLVSQRLLTELIINKPLEPLDFIIDFLKRDDDGELHELEDYYFNIYVCLLCLPYLIHFIVQGVSTFSCPHSNSCSQCFFVSHTAKEFDTPVGAQMIFSRGGQIRGSWGQKSSTRSRGTWESGGIALEADNMFWKYCIHWDLRRHLISY